MLHLMNIENGEVRGTQRLGASVNYSPEFSATEPNQNLLRRLAEAGGGKVLDPDMPADNPFQHDRVKTFQPRDWWEWLLKFAIILFPLDVAVRRIQLDRAEWMRATQTLRRWLFFWRGVARSPEADESLAALLARRDVVRSKQTAPQGQPSPDLFEPEHPVVILPEKKDAAPPEPSARPDTGPGSSATPTDQRANTTSRLLEAKRRAQQRKEK
jgi:hypothetical protein